MAHLCEGRPSFVFFVVAVVVDLKDGLFPKSIGFNPHILLRGRSFQEKKEKNPLGVDQTQLAISSRSKPTAEASFTASGIGC